MKPFDNVIVSATEPKNNADVWVKHGKNLYKGQSLQNGLYAGASNTIGSNSNGWYVIVPITGGATYTISKKYTNADNSNLQLFLCTTQDFPAKGVSMIDIWRGSVSLANTTIETSENANYLFICLAAGSKSIITEEIQKMAVEELMVEVGAEKKDYEAPLEDDILVNDNGVYNSILQDIKDRLNALESQATQNTAENNI